MVQIKKVMSLFFRLCRHWWPFEVRQYNSLQEVIDLSPRAAAPTLTQAMLPPSVRDFVPEDLQDRDLPLWYAAFETGRQAATTTPVPGPTPAPAQRSRPTPERPPPEAPIPANYGDDVDDEDSTLDALLNYAKQSRPQIDPGKLASIAPNHQEIGQWIKDKSLPSGRLMDMMLDSLVEAHGKSILKP